MKTTTNYIFETAPVICSMNTNTKEDIVQNGFCCVAFSLQEKQNACKALCDVFSRGHGK